jgi:hypothetical protein
MRGRTIAVAAWRGMMPCDRDSSWIAGMFFDTAVMIRATAFGIRNDPSGRWRSAQPSAPPMTPPQFTM